MLQRLLMQTMDLGLNPPVVERGLRLDTLLWLRWMMLLALSVSIIVNQFILEWSLPLLICVALLCAFVAITLYIGRRYRAKTRLEPNLVTSLLMLDLAQLCVILYLTGGLANPFCFLLLVPVMVGATTLRRRHTLTLALFVVLTISLPEEFYFPILNFDGAPIMTSAGYINAVWLALITGVAFMSIYGFRLADESRNLTAALNATELVLAREQYLSRLDGMAAAAAHELGTPLSTIAVIARELQREIPSNSPFRGDIDLLNSQSIRCKEILSKLSSLGPEMGSPTLFVRVQDMVEELADPHRNFGVIVNVIRDPAVEDETTSPQFYRLPGVLYGLSNIIENAVDFAESRVEITLSWDNENVTIKIQDDGPGFSPIVLPRLGEPYVTSRQSRPNVEKNAVEGGGLGLGIFIAKTLLERTGATITFSNVEKPDSGACVIVNWRDSEIRVPLNEGINVEKNDHI